MTLAATTPDTAGMEDATAASGMAPYAALALAGCVWGTGFYFGKIDLAELGVGHMLFYRFAFACLGLLPFAFRLKIVPRRKDLPLFLIAAALYVPVQFIVQFHGLKYTTVTHASLMVGTLPLILAAGAVIFTHEKLDRTGWLLLLVSTIGAALIVAQARGSGAASAGPTLLGDLLVLGSLFCSVGWVLVTQRVMHAGQGYPALVMSVYILLFGSLMLAAIVLATDGLPPVHGVSSTAWLALAGQGLIATTLPTLLWNWALLRVPAARAGIFLNFEPVVGTLLGVTFMRDTLSAGAVIGGALIVGAAITFTVRAARSAAA